MHVVFRESTGLEEIETPSDLRQTPADLVVLSFSDSDLGAFAAGWRRAGGTLPSLRLANLAALRHPLSVDTYVERTLAGARGILVRLIGGAPYWRYGLQQVEALARAQGIALAVLPADGREDRALDAASTLPLSTLRRLGRLCDAGGAVAAQAALAQLALASGLYAGPVQGTKALPELGAWTPEAGVTCPAGWSAGARQRRVLVVFYRAYLAAADLEPVEALVAALRARGFDALGLFVPSLKAPGAGSWLRRWVAALAPAAVVNATAFSGRGSAPEGGLPSAGGGLTGSSDRGVASYPGALGICDHGENRLGAEGGGSDSHRDGRARSGGQAPGGPEGGECEEASSPLDAAGVPVLQVALSTASRAAWSEAARGLSPADLAMHVVLPEVDGRLFAGVVSFKEAGARDPDLQWARVAHRADADRVAAIADRVAAWTELAAVPAAEKRLALVLSTYPGKTEQMAHAVGLDALASAEAMLEDLGAAGYHVAPGAPLAAALGAIATTPPEAGLEAALGAPPEAADGASESGPPEAAPGAASGAPPEAPLGAGSSGTAREGILTWPLGAYRAALATLPAALPAALAQAWGAPEADPACDGGAFRFGAVQRGKVMVALQPERGAADEREAAYHDLTRVPRHGYVAFYLWLRQALGIHALVHIGAHGTLEWLPGKAVALSDACWPEALVGRLPVVYPFIVNDPGEAAQAKRRIGAVTIGHIPPPLRRGGTPERMARLEALLDEFSSADGLDPRRRDRLQADIRAEAQAVGVEADLGLDRTASAAEAITRIDRFVCDVKETQFGDGLHVFGRPPRAPEAAEGAAGDALALAMGGADGDGPAEAAARAAGDPAVAGPSTESPRRALGAASTGATDAAGARGRHATRGVATVSTTAGAMGHAQGRGPEIGALPGAATCAAAERRGLLDALAGRLLAPGPSGSPWRGRLDVLPTGRNLYTTDPRAVPTRAAYAQGVRLAEEVVRRHLQDHGDYPRGLVVDLWGSATMRTAGEEFAMALHLIGARPVWDAGSERVSGVEILPIALLERPRLDVTLRLSGLFRDVFPSLSALYAQAVRALAARDEAPDWNPYAGRPEAARVYGPAPGAYGAGIGRLAEEYGEAARRAAGEAWLAASAWAQDGERGVEDRAGLAARVAAADAFVHLQDLPESDLLLAADHAAHEAGFAAAQAVTGGSAALYHLDATDPARPRARSLREEVARVVRGRAANPAWVEGMMRHGFRGGAELAATLDHLGAFAQLAGVVEEHLIELYHDATLARPEVRAFLAAANPAALAAMEARFARLREAGFWRPRRNAPRAGAGPA